MSGPGSQPLLPVSLRREGDQLVVEWNDGHRGVYSWPGLRRNCPCAGCREERDKPPDPFRILSANELVALAPVSMAPVGRYAYKIVWTDGHDTGIYTLEHLRQLCECPACKGEPGA